MSKLKTLLGGTNVMAASLGSLVQGVQSAVDATGRARMMDTNDMGVALALESADTADMGRIQGAVDSLNAALESFSGEEVKAGMTGKGNKEAAVLAGLLASDPKAFARHRYPEGEGAKGVPGVERMREALEAYDERDNASVTAYSTAFNYRAARQDEFGEAFFPTIVITPDQVGYSVGIDLVEVQNDFKRNVSGALEAMGRRNIIQGLRDGKLLDNDSTRIYPVAQAASTANFLANSLLTWKDQTVANDTFKTAPLLFGKKFSLIGLSQTAALLAAGVMGPTDAIDTSVILDKVYLQVTGTVSSATVNEIIAFDVSRTPGAHFNYAVQGNYRQMVVNYSTRSAMINGDTTMASGSASVLLASIGAGNYKVNLSFDVDGKVNLDTAETSINASEVVVHSVLDPAGNVHAPTDAAVAAIVALFAGAKLVAYDLHAYRANMNRRQRGQLLNLNRFSQNYTVPLLAPITIPRPQGSGDATDTSDLAALITACRIRTSAAAVKELLAADAALAAWIDGREHIGDVPEVLGMARFLVQPYYKKVEFDAALATNSVRSQDRAKDIQAALVAQIRDLVYQAYKDSGYKGAADSVNGGNSEHPIVLIGTDQVLSRYLWVEGDLRTLGVDFETKIVSTMNEDMAGKIFVTFATKAAQNGVSDPLNFGNMGWRPELTLVLPLTRDGQFSKELTASPAFKHVVNLPVLIRIDVTNLSETAVKKTSVDFNDI